MRNLSKKIGYGTAGLSFLASVQAFAASTTRTVEGETIRSIELEGNSKVILTQGSTQKIEIIGNAERIHNEYIFVRNGELKANFKRAPDCSNNCEITYKIQITKDFREIEHSGKMELEASKLDLQRLEVETNGSSDIKLEGNINRIEFDMSGKSNLIGKNLDVQTADVEVSGIGDLVLKVNKELETQLSGAVTFDVIGNPSIRKQEVSGMSSLRKKI